MASVVQSRAHSSFGRLREAYEAILSMLLGVGIIFLLFLQRAESFGWRLAAYGALTGFSISFCCRTLHRVAQPIYRREILPHSLAAAIVFSIGGAVG